MLLIENLYVPISTYFEINQSMCPYRFQMGLIYYDLGMNKKKIEGPASSSARQLTSPYKSFTPKKLMTK